MRVAHELSVAWLGPGRRALAWKPDQVGVIPMYCTDFCSALHQEMQGYVRVSPAGSSVPLRFGTGSKAPQEGSK